MEPSLGAYLRQERLDRGVNLADIASETRVPEASLLSIEEDRLDDLPGEVFVRGFLRAYAKCIDLDPEEVLARLDRPAPRPTMPMAHTASLDLRRRRLSTPALLLVLAIACVLIALVLWRPLTMPSLLEQGSIPTLSRSG